MLLAILVIFPPLIRLSNRVIQANDPESIDQMSEPDRSRVIDHQGSRREQVPH